MTIGGVDGLINLDKAAGMSSARAVAQVKRLLPRKSKIGHAGTLDPFATGVLVLLVGKATKQCERLMDQPKQYEATVKFGATTATDDPESPEEPWVRRSTEVVAHRTGVASTGADAEAAESGRASFPAVAPPPPPRREAIDAILPRFIGSIQQRPPAFSALKVGGQRAYKLARGGELVALEPRTVRVYGIEVLDYAWPLLRLRIDCGRGTYIRSIARDLGEALDVGGHLTQLRRTRVGELWVGDAITLEQLAEEGVETHVHAIDAG